VAWITALIAAVVFSVLVLTAPPLAHPWPQNYDPTGHWWLSTLIAALPIVVLLGTLALLHIKAHFAALLGLSTGLATAVLIFHMPARLAATTAVYGAGYGLFPIGWIILNVIFMYQLTVEAGQFKVLQSSMTGITQDRRLQLLLIAFCFGAFFEGAAGFGTPVAVTAALLIGLGFKPLEASGLSLIANTAPVAFGALGTPIIALAKVTGMSEILLGAMAGRILAPFCLLVPFWLIWAFVGFSGMLEIHDPSNPGFQFSRSLAGEHRCRRSFHDLPDRLSVHLASEKDLDLSRRREQGRSCGSRLQPLGSCTRVDTVGHP
jgi:lactate permease